MDQLEPRVNGYHQWQKAVLRDETLGEIAARGYFDIRLVAYAIAIHGENGRGCFATSSTLSGVIGCERHAVERYRQTLIDLGWFKVVSRNGGVRRRALVLDISIPAEHLWASGNADETVRPNTLAHHQRTRAR
jgi:hypothetical protein